MVRVCSLGFVLVLFALLVIIVVKTYNGNNLMRKRRKWIVPQKLLKENMEYAQEECVADILSDADINADVIYSLLGIIANQYPFHVFVVDKHKTGIIRVKVLEREGTATYNLSGIATYTGHPETDTDIRIQAVDENDPPVFGSPEVGAVMEPSPAGTSVMKITATAADEPGDESSQTVYSIIHQKPPGDSFTMTQDGTLYVDQPLLDREKADVYIVIVKGQDLNGKPEGNTATGTVMINIQV